MTDLVDRNPPSHPAARDAGRDVFVDLSEVVTAPSLIVLVDVDALQPIERTTLRVLDALGHSRAQLVLYSHGPSSESVRMRIELPRASWLYPSSIVQPAELVGILKKGIEGSRVLAIGISPDLRRALDPDDDSVLSLAVADPADSDTYRRTVLCATLWSIVKLRYRIRETTAE